MAYDTQSLENKSQVMPLLVQLYDSQNIKALAKNKDASSRSELTELIVTLLAMDLSPREAELVADVLISLMRQIEKDICIALSERLSVMESVPLRLALHIANENIDIAKPMLRKSQVFNDMDLIYIIKSKSKDYWKAIAEREDLSESIIDSLADTQDIETAQVLLENKNIILTDYSLACFVNMAKNSDDIARPLLQRDEVTVDIVKTLYQCVGMALKDYIRQEFEINEADVMGAVDDVVLEFVDAVDQVIEDVPGSIKPAEHHVEIADSYKSREILSLQMILQTLKRGQYKSFIAQFGAYLGVDENIVNDVMMQQNGQGLAIICRAEGIQRNDFVSIYLLATRLRNKGGMVDSKDLNRATQYYDNIDINMARKLMRGAREHGTSIVPKH